MADRTSAVPTMKPAPPRRFCQAGCLAMPATKREKMKATSASATQTASCQPVPKPTANGVTSSIGESGPGLASRLAT